LSDGCSGAVVIPPPEVCDEVVPMVPTLTCGLLRTNFSFAANASNAEICKAASASKAAPASFITFDRLSMACLRGNGSMLGGRLGPLT